MKKISLALVALLLCVSTCKPIENDTSACKKIEQISPDASPEQYKALVAMLRDAKLSVCDCVKQNAEERINDQNQALKKEWQISEQDWKDIDAITQRIVQQDNQLGKTIIDVDLKSFPKKYVGYFTEENIRNIKNKFREIGYTNNTINIVYDPPREIEGNELIDSVKSSRYLQKGGAKNPSLALGPVFFAQSLQAQQGTLLHEINGHLAHKDPILDSLLLIAASRSDDKRELLKAENQQKFFNSQSMINRKKAEELRADQVPAAASVANAHLIETWFAEHKQKHGNSADYIHGSIEDRWKMAKRIRQLLEAEAAEQLTSNAQQINPGTQPKCFFSRFFKRA